MQTPMYPSPSTPVLRKRVRTLAEVRTLAAGANAGGGCDHQGRHMRARRLVPCRDPHATLVALLDASAVESVGALGRVGLLERFELPPGELVVAAAGCMGLDRIRFDKDRIIEQWIARSRHAGLGLHDLVAGVAILPDGSVEYLGTRLGQGHLAAVQDGRTRSRSATPPPPTATGRVRWPTARRRRDRRSTSRQSPRPPQRDDPPTPPNR